MFGFRLRLKAPELLLLCFCLLRLSGITLGQENGPDVIKVEEGSDAILPCSLSTKESIVKKRFHLKKDGQKEVFLYDWGFHVNNGHPGQDKQFKGRVSHFENELKNGNASIIIRNTTVADSGNYTCALQNQAFYIKLIVCVFPKPSVRILNQTKDWALLQCEVLGASPKPKVEWQDSAGTILPAEDRQVSERGGSYNITLNTTVTKTDNFSCVVTQEEINYQTDAEIYVLVNEKLSVDTSSKVIIGCLVGIVAVLALLVAAICIKKRCNNGSREDRNTSPAELPLNPQPV